MILQMSLDDPDVRNSVVGVPIYLHTMIAYSSAFLLKAKQKAKIYDLDADPNLILDLVTRIIDMLLEARAGERHLSGHIATGLRKMLGRMKATETSQVLNPPRPTTEVPGTGYLQQTEGEVWGAPNYFGVPDNGVLRMFDESVVPFSNEHFFPLGFFDVISAPNPEMDYRPREG
jgi:hypothetical protein